MTREQVARALGPYALAKAWTRGGAALDEVRETRRVLAGLPTA